jgi:transposase-like protein
LQTCIVHLLRHSLEFANWKQRKPLAALEDFERGEWGQRFPTIVAAWRRARTHVTPFLPFRPRFGGRRAMNQFAILYSDRFTPPTT